MNTHSMWAIDNLDNVLDLQVVVVGVERNSMATVLLFVDGLVFDLHGLPVIVENLKAFALQSHYNSNLLSTK